MGLDKAIFNAAPCAALIAGGNGLIQKANLKAVELLGYSSEELSEIKINALLVSVDNCQNYANLLNLSDAKHETMSDEPCSQAMYAVHKSGNHIPVEISSNTVIYKDSHYLVLTLKDISEQDDLKKKLQAAYEKAENNKSSLNNLIYITAHDLQEPLINIKSIIEIFRNSNDDNFNTEHYQYLNLISDTVTGMKQKVRTLMEFARISKPKPFSHTDCNEVLQEAIQALQPQISQTNARIYNDTLPEVTGDPGEIKLLFTHLLSNAIKFRQEGCIPEVRISYRDVGEYHSFEISDNGRGIDEKDQCKIFQMFTRFHSDTTIEGNGSGLALCDKIVEAHGGKIWIKSTPGKGSTFYFTISKNLCQSLS